MVLKWTLPKRGVLKVIVSMNNVLIKCYVFQRVKTAKRRYEEKFKDIGIENVEKGWPLSDF